MQYTPFGRKQLTFFSLYMAQSVPMSLISTLLPVIMRQEHFSLSSIGLLQLVKLPWIAKLLWAPIVDRNTSNLASYKRWIFSSELAYALALVAVAFLQIKLHFSLILGLIVLAFVCSATQDIATDALTSLTFRGDVVRANRLQSMGQFAGTIFGGGVLMMLYHSLGWTALFLLMAALVMLFLLPLYTYKSEVQIEKKLVHDTDRIGLNDIVSFFSQKDSFGRIHVLVLLNFGLVGTMAMMKPYLVDLKYSLKDIGLLFTLYGASMGFLGSMLLSRFRKVLDIHQGLRYAAMFIGIAAFVIAMLAFLGLYSLPYILLSLGLLWAAYGFGTVMVYSFAMDYVRAGREGTDFTLQIVIPHLSGLLIASFSGGLSERLGYSGFFALEAVFSLISLLYVFYWTRRH